MHITDISVELIDHMGSDLSVVNAARVSFHKESEYVTGEDGITKLKYGDEKLISYLAQHNHWSPFAHAFASFRIKAPIFLARQLVKHQVGLVWNEVSRRYVDEEPEFWFPETWRKRAENVKQGSSSETTDFKFTHPETGMDLRISEHATFLVQNILYLYNEMIKNGVAPEQARMILPQNTMTEWIWSGSLAAFARVIKLRTDPHAQLEAQEVANLIKDKLAPVFPVALQALLEN